MHVQRDSLVYGLCASRAILMHMTCALLLHVTYACPHVIVIHLKRSCTPKIFCSMTQTTILAL